MQLRFGRFGRRMKEVFAGSQKSPEIGPTTPQSDLGPRTLLDYEHVPDEVWALVVCKLDHSRDLVSLSSTSSRFSAIVEGCGAHWQLLWRRAYGEVTPVQHRAAELAGSWQRLYRSKAVAQAEVLPWERPSPYEVEASIEHMLHDLSLAATPSFLAAAAPSSSEASKATLLPPSDAPAAPTTLSTCVVFLVDGSGSVTEDDFACMTQFMNTAARQMVAAAEAADRPLPALSIIQFSNDCRVELAPTCQVGDGEEHGEDAPEGSQEGGGAEEEGVAGGKEGSSEDAVLVRFEAAVAGMRRMNGGTNVAAAVKRAGQLLKPLGPGTRRVVALLTDGRIDSYQAREASAMVARLADEQGNLACHAFAVGRGADRHELLRIVKGACGEEEALARYLPLMVLDDAPW